LKFVSRFLPIIFAAIAVLNLLSWWRRGDLGDLCFGVGFFLVLPRTILYPLQQSGSTQLESDHSLKKITSNVLWWAGALLVLSGLIISWL